MHVISKLLICVAVFIFSLVAFFTVAALLDSKGQHGQDAACASAVLAFMLSVVVTLATGAVLFW
jgi:hypothetical protein